MKLSRKRLMEIAGLSVNESTGKVQAAIQKNKTALLQAIKKRLADPEDFDAHDEVQELIVKTAVDAGMDRQDAEDTPWMESYAVPDEMTPEENLEMLEDELSEYLENI